MQQIWTKLTIEQVSHFYYLGCDSSYDYNNDVNSKLDKFQAPWGTIRHPDREEIKGNSTQILSCHDSTCAPE